MRGNKIKNEVIDKHFFTVMRQLKPEIIIDAKQCLTLYRLEPNHAGFADTQTCINNAGKSIFSTIASVTVIMTVMILQWAF